MRMREHMKNALAVAKALEANPRVTKVVHPGKIERITMKCQSAEMWNACKINNENKTRDAAVYDPKYRWMF